MTMPIPQKSAEEIAELARRVVTHEVYVAWDSESLRCSFGAFLALTMSSLQENNEDVSWVQDVGLLYEDWSKAGERSLNGYPVFMSARLVHKADRIPLHRECCRLLVALGKLDQEELDRLDAEIARRAEVSG